MKFKFLGSQQYLELRLYGIVFLDSASLAIMEGIPAPGFNHFENVSHVNIDQTKNGILCAKQRINDLARYIALDHDKQDCERLICISKRN